MAVNVYHLGTGELRVYAGATPRKAVMAAYAQARGDMNSWDYESRYGHETWEGRQSVHCGDWAALKENECV